MHKRNFDSATANKVDKAKWIKDHKAHGNDEELGAIWDELQVKKPKQEESKEK